MIRPSNPYERMIYRKRMRRRLAVVEWGANNKIVRALYVVVSKEDLRMPLLDRINKSITCQHRFDEYDVNWCERDQCYYAWNVGHSGGPVHLYRFADNVSHRLWADIDITFYDASNPDETLRENELLDAEIKEMGYALVRSDECDSEVVDILNYADEESCAWCKVCSDMLPENDLCAHFYWCEDCCAVQEEDTPCSCERDIDE